MDVSGMGKAPVSAALWLARACHRMTSRATHDDDLNDEARETLRTEAAQLRELAVALLTQGRALEDFAIWQLASRREDTYVLDGLCDGAQTETYAILGLKTAVLSAAGKTREGVLGAPLTTIKKVGRARTVAYARDVTRELRALPDFPEREGLATKLARRGEALDVATDALFGTETEESERSLAIETSLDNAKNQAIRAYGRLLDRFPRNEVEALFPRRERHRASAASGTDEASGAGETPTETP